MRFERVFLLAGGMSAAGTLFAAAGGCSSESTHAESQGSGGGCLLAPHPNLFVDIHSPGDASLPDDTSIAALWSGGEAGPWVLDDPTTWSSLEASDLVCDIDRENPTASLKALHCEVWTTGPTRIRVNALGFLPFDRTLVPSPFPCAPTPHLVVELDKPDGGS